MRALFLTLFIAACTSSGPTTGGQLVGLGGAVASSANGASFVLHDLRSTVDLWSLSYAGRLGWAVGDHGSIFHTVDGGSSWTTQQSGTQANLRSVAFADELSGIAIGELGSILSTEDGGTTWIAMPANGKELPSAATANAASWWVASEFGGLWESRDGARSFVRQTVPAGTFRAITFSADTKTGFAVGDGGVVIRTTDGAATWTAASTAPADLRAVAVDRSGSDVIAVGGQGLVWRSIDGGATFGSVEISPRAKLYGVAFRASSSDAWLVGENGTILFSADRAETFTTLDSPSATTWTAVVGAM